MRITARALLAFALLALSYVPAEASRPRVRRASAAATCRGAANCRACKNCKYCKHCAKEGGTCGVCRGERKWSDAVADAAHY